MSDRNNGTGADTDAALRSAENAAVDGQNLALSDLPDSNSAIDVPEPQLERIVERGVRVAMKSERYAGPMPKPEHLRQYDEIVPGAARIIVDEFQANSRHSRLMSELGLRGAIDRDKRAQWIAGGLVLIGFLLVYLLADRGYPWVAGGVATTLLVAVLTGYLTGQVSSNRAEREDQDDEDK